MSENFGGNMDSNDFYPSGPWHITFPKHLLALETTLLKKNVKLQSQVSIYLAGIIARKLDKSYWDEIEANFLLESPDQIFEIIRNHSVYLGQNAPIVTVSKYNAEHILIQIATQALNYVFYVRIPARFFRIASTYSYYSGNQKMGDLFFTFSQNIEILLPHITSYMDELKSTGQIPEPNPIIQSLWEKFANSVLESTPKNTMKDYDATVQLESLIRSFAGNN